MKFLLIETFDLAIYDYIFSLYHHVEASFSESTTRWQSLNDHSIYLYSIYLYCGNDTPRGVPMVGGIFFGKKESL